MRRDGLHVRRAVARPAAVLILTLVSVGGAAWMMRNEVRHTRSHSLRRSMHASESWQAPPPPPSDALDGGSTAPDPPAALLENWCVAGDKQAAGWGNLTDAECMQRFTQQREQHQQEVRAGSGTLVFKHVHKAGGTTLCQLGQRNGVAEDVALPFRADWTTNCVPYEAFLGPHPAVGGGSATSYRQIGVQAHAHAAARRRLHAPWLGGACFFGFLTPAQLKALPNHFRPLTFIASEGPMPDVFPLDAPFALVTMLRHPLDRALSSYKWWSWMTTAMPSSPAECRAYWAPANATLPQWLAAYPDNWMTRELVGTSTLYRRTASGAPAELTPADVARAKSRLHYFGGVLVMERWEASLALMRARYGWRELDHEKHRAGSQRNSAAEAELAGQPEVLADLRRRNAHDLEVYRYALALHERQAREEGVADVARRRA